MSTSGLPQIRPGESARFTVKVGEFSDGSPISIPVVATRGTADGPVLWLTGLVHGDEFNGAVAALQSVTSLHPQDFSGMVVCTPIANPLAYLARQRVSFTDNLDIDQQFPGVRTGITTQRTAYRLFSMIQTHATHVISFHSVGAPMMSNAYAVFKRAPDVNRDVERETARIALAFGTQVTCMVDVATATGELPGQLAGSLDRACMQAGIPSFMAEIGGGARLQPESTAQGIRGVRNVMRFLRMLPPDEPRSDSEPEAMKPVVITKRQFLTADKGGLWETAVKPGGIVSKGGLIGRLGSWLGESMEIRASQDVYIILLRANPAVYEGDRLAFVGTEWVSDGEYEAQL